MMDKIRKNVTSAFRINGFSISGDASLYMIEILKDFPESQQSMWIEKIIDKVQRQNLNSSFVTKEVVELAAKECGKGDAHSQEDIFCIINAFEVPKLTYDSGRKKFLKSLNSPTLLCDGIEKPYLYRNRYDVLLQRTLHHDVFTPSIIGTEVEEESTKYNLRTIEFLSGSSSKVSEVVVLGMLTQLKEGKFYLEDPTGSVELDLTNVNFQNGFFPECCFVLAEGHYEDGIFHVKEMGHPPTEDAATSRKYYGTTNFFGGPSGSINRERLELIERQNEDNIFVILSEVHLDSNIVLEKLRILFEGFSEANAGLFILMGNFLSRPHGSQSAIALRDALKDLADIISDFPILVQNSRFVIIPGPLDPGFVHILPRPPLADVITKYFLEKVPNAAFATNPCRIKYCTKEIVVCREDLLSKMCRNSLYHPNSAQANYESLAESFVTTLVGQSHLCPLPLHICPVYWSYDHAMSLYPLPDLVIVGEACDPFALERYGCQFVNPGSFVKSNYSFKTYTPYEHRVDECQLPSS